MERVRSTASVASRMWLAGLIALTACGGAPAAQPAAPPTAEPAKLVLIGTNDLHGRVRALPYLAGYLAIVRRQHPSLVLLDAGDLFQGTLASNLREGAPVIDAYNALAYDAAAVGNHEFDYGPVGPDATATRPGQDPRGALKARVAQAAFPFLSANLHGGRDFAERIGRSTMLRRGGLRVGVIGLSTAEVLTTTLAANVRGLRVEPLLPATVREARQLRAAGADLVLVSAHAGGDCQRVDDPEDLSTCRMDEEIFALAQALPPGTVDAIVGGHTHRALAHRVHGIPIIESYAYGRAFGRVDFTVATDGGVASRIYPPQMLCRAGSAQTGDCEPGRYEGQTVTPDTDIAARLAPALAEEDAARARPIGITLSAPFRRAYARESALGNLFADLMREATGAEVAITNGGGLRADLPAGPLRYGSLYEAMPFDNRFARLEVSAAALADVVGRNLRGERGFLSVSGLRVQARCEAGALRVSLAWPDGRAIEPDRLIALATSDFLATGGDGLELSSASAHADDARPEDDVEMVRDGMARRLAARGGRLDPDEVYRADERRVVYPGARPLRCDG